MNEKLSIREQEEKDIQDLTDAEDKEVRDFLTTAYPNIDNWTLGEIATQARYWREAKNKTCA